MLIALQADLERVADGGEHEEDALIVNVEVVSLFFELDDLDLVALDAVAVDRGNFTSHDFVDVTDGVFNGLRDVLVVHQGAVVETLRWEGCV